MTKLKPIIGMEVHVELNTLSKMFCGCPAKHFQVKPNTHTCPVCLGLPGALPVPNKKAVDFTQMIGLALNSSINKHSKFDRKHYFYPDLPKGYQISQYDMPLCTKGFLTLDSGKKINLTRVHLEEDTGKLLHKTINGKNVSLIDFNRSGVPLVEIVSEPEISSGKQAKDYLKKLTTLIKTLKVSDCDMEKGSMRLEANISLAKDGKSNYKVEVKNLNSFRFVEKAIDFELKRQEKILKTGQVPKQETRGYDPKTKTTFSQRSKETAEDYRYFPEPDIPPMIFTNQDIEKLKTKLPELPEAKLKTLVSQHQLPPATARLLISQPVNLNYFQANLKLANKLKLTATKLANLIINKKINPAKSAKPQLIKLTQKQDIDPGIITQVIKDNPDVVKKFKAGKTSVIGFLVGQVMKLSKGQADPNLTKDMLTEKLKQA